MSRKPKQHALPKVQPVTVPTGLPYGEATQLAQAQQAQPLPVAGQPPPVAGQPQVHPDVAALQAAQATPPPVAPIHAPTTRPNEPLTAGMHPVNQPAPSLSETTINLLRGMYAQNPSPEILALITEAQAQ